MKEANRHKACANTRPTELLITPILLTNKKLNCCRYRPCVCGNKAHSKKQKQKQKKHHAIPGHKSHFPCPNRFVTQCIQKHEKANGNALTLK